MDSCCDVPESLDPSKQSQRRVALWIVLAVNLCMFFIEFTQGLKAHSTSLLADSIDMLSDAFMYGITLFVLASSVRAKNSAALIKGIMMAAFGVAILIQAFIRLSENQLPHYPTMTWVGILAFTANLACTMILMRHRNDDLNMKSVWICSRNDLIANIGIIIAAFLVAKTQSLLPDFGIGVLVALIELKSSFFVIRTSFAHLRKPS